MPADDLPQLHPADRAALARRDAMRLHGIAWVHEHEFLLDTLLGHTRWRDAGYRFVPVATDGTGSTWCLWVRPANGRAPVVLFESEGRSGTVADNLDVLLDGARPGYLPDAARQDDAFGDWLERLWGGDPDARRARQAGEATLGAALVELDPAEAYRHLEAAVMALPGASSLSKRSFELLETLPEP